MPSGHLHSHKCISWQFPAPEAATEPTQVSLNDLLPAEEAAYPRVQLLDSPVLSIEHAAPKGPIFTLELANHLVYLPAQFVVAVLHVD